MMHILYLTQYYVTEDQPGSPRHDRHAKYLLRNGHRVTMVTSFVNHQERVIPEQYRGQTIVREDPAPNFTVYRTYASPSYKVDVLSRLMNYFTFMYYAFRAGYRVQSVDVVFASINPVSVGIVGWVLGVLFRRPFVLEVCDLSAEGAQDLKVVKSRGFIALVRAVERFLFRHAGRVIVLARGIGRAVLAAGVPPDRVSFVPLGVDSELMEPRSDLRGIRRTPSEFIALYAGNFAHYASLDTVVRAAHLLRDVTEIRIAFVGGGDRRAMMEQLVNELGLTNVTIYDPRPKRDVATILADANVCILPYRRANVLRGVLPNKLFDYLGSRRPIVAAALPGEVTEIIEESGAGLCVEPENPQALADAILSLYHDPVRAREMGERGHRYVLERYDRDVIMQQYLATIEAAVLV